MIEPFAYFATTPHGAEDLLVEELRCIGIEAKLRAGGAAFHGTLEDGLRACLWLRTASRLLLHLAELAAGDGDSLYAGVQGLDWTNHLERGATLSINASGVGAIGHSHFAALRVKDAIVDQLRDRWSDRPDVDTHEPDIALGLHLRGDRATLSLDLGGEGLHRRGYRVDQGAAPLRENLAAAVLLRAGWAGQSTLLDPFCGSGTLLIEAAWIAGDVAPGLRRRRWGFTRWPGRDEDCWQRLMAEAEARRVVGLERELTGPLIGFDADSRAIRAANACIDAAGLRGRVHVERRDFADVRPSGDPGLIVTNPPWGERLGTRRELERLYAEIGAHLRRHFVGWEVALLAGDPGLGRFLGINAHHRNVLNDGPIVAQVLRLRVDAESPERSSEPRAPRPRSESGRAFANRLAKNRKKLEPWLAREGIGCFRLYDADIPETNVVVDLYLAGETPDAEPELHAHVQEYAAPPTIDPDLARMRLREALMVIREDLGLPRERVHLKRRERQRAGSQYEKLDRSGREFVVREGPARFWVNFEDYLDSGLFLDHRPLRAKLRDLATGKRLLNLFCYTATASVHAAIGGAASTTSIDLSRTYLEWAERNFDLNRISVVQAASRAQGGRHRLIRDNVVEWLRQDTRDSWDVIFCDPPSYSKSKRMDEDFDVQRDHVEVIRRCADRLAPDGLLIFSTNLRSFELDRRLTGLRIEDWTKPSIPRDFERSGAIHHCYWIRH